VVSLGSPHSSSFTSHRRANLCLRWFDDLSWSFLRRTGCMGRNRIGGCGLLAKPFLCSYLFDVIFSLAPWCFRYSFHDGLHNLLSQLFMVCIYTDCSFTEGRVFSEPDKTMSIIYIQHHLPRESTTTCLIHRLVKHLLQYQTLNDRTLKFPLC